MTIDAFESGLRLAERLRNREFTCEALLDFYLERAQRLNPQLNAIIAFDEERARTDARDADADLTRGHIRGPFHGVPMTVKESYDVAGLPTTRGNPVWQNHRADQDAVAIRRLRAAGAIIYGKTNVPLNLADFQSYNDIYGTTNNPWDVERTPGGSSGGSAASLAAGLAAIETGSDIGGSIRNPAHYCGVFGHKPTWGMLPTRGHAAPGVLAPSDLTVIGPLARTAADLEALTLAMAGPDEIEANGYQLALPPCPHSSLATLKVAVWTDSEHAPVDQETQHRVMLVAQAIEAAGGTVVAGAAPEFDLGAAQETYQDLLQAVMASRNPEAAWREMSEAAGALAADDDSPRAKLLRRSVASYRSYTMAHEERTRLRWRWHEFFQGYDALITPIMATAAFPHNQGPPGERRISVDNTERPYFEQVFWAGLAVNAYLPSTVIPTGGQASGLPIGVQIIGPEYGDLKTMGIARLLEAAGFGFVPPPGY